MSISRRKFLKSASLVGATIPLTGLVACGKHAKELQSDPLYEYTYEGPLGPENAFEHGVASGDPSGSTVVIWTRVTTAFEDPQTVEVFWEIATDADFNERVATGLFITGSKRDYTVKVIPAGLEPGTQYFYRFQALGRTSPIGETKTVVRGTAESVRFGLVSCSNLRRGYFHAYRNLAARNDLDAILHLGDYYYESGGAGEVQGRDHEPPWELLSLEDYRVRFANYRRDPDLQELHRKLPWIAVWDDHESANNAFFDGASAHQTDEGDWFERKAASQRAYFEWMPIREQAEFGQIWRTIRFGDLVDLSMLDTRIWGRAEQAINVPGLDDERQLLGDDQEAWLFDELKSSTSVWRVLGQQVMMGQLKALGRPNEVGGGAFINLDQWDGYRGARKRLYDVIGQNEVTDLVVLTGDIHSSWANELTQDPNNPDTYNPETGEGSVGVEFVTPGVTSAGLNGLPDNIVAQLDGANPHIKYFELTSRGYVVLEFNREFAQADFHHVTDVTNPETTEAISASYRVERGSNHLQMTDTSLDA